MGKNPLLYIIIVNWNGFKYTRTCINSVLKSDYKNIKIILVDNGSKSNQAEKLKRIFPQIVLIKNKNNLGFSKANNQGIKFALKKAAEYIFILNNDTVIDKKCLSTLIRYCKYNNFKGLVAPKILFHNTKIIWSLGGRHQPFTTIPRLIGQGKHVDKIKNDVIQPEFLTGCALLVHRSVFEKIGFFDEEFFAYHEDIDFSYRAKDGGFELLCLPESIVWHKVSKSTKQGPGKVGEIMGYLMARNGLIFGYKSFKGFKKIYYLFAQIFIKTPLYLLFKTNDLKSSVSYLKGLYDGSRYILKFGKH